MGNNWVLVANSSTARLYNLKGKKINLISEHNHPESRQKSGEIASDRPGQYLSHNSGVAHGSYADSTDPKEYEIERFAHELAEHLNSARKENRYSRLALVAPPQFHGMLNKHMNPNVSSMVVARVDKDYTKVTEDKLLEMIEKQQHISQLA